jgi:preprotein translocase subunit YajC
MDPLSTGLLIVLMVASFYLLIIRPNQRRKADQARLQEALKPGARVMLSSGIYGTVVEIGERQAVVEVAPGIHLTVLKQSVLQAVTPGSQFAEDSPGDDAIEQPTGESLPDTPPSGEPLADESWDIHGPEGRQEPGQPTFDREQDHRPPEGGEKR